MISGFLGKIYALARMLKLVEPGYQESGVEEDSGTTKQIILVGTPNVGKSLVFNRLSGTRTTVSNYPGTTVDITKAHIKLDGVECDLLDTPGMYSLLPLTEEERVARSILFNKKPDAVLQVMDSRDLERMLPLTFQLIEADIPLILDLNMIDEAERMGLGIDVESLEKDLGIPVITTVATTGQGIAELKKRLKEYIN